MFWAFISKIPKSIQVSEKLNISLALVKRETGENPVRTRHRI